MNGPFSGVVEMIEPESERYATGMSGTIGHDGRHLRELHRNAMISD